MHHPLDATPWRNLLMPILGAISRSGQYQTPIPTQRLEVINKIIVCIPVSTPQTLERAENHAQPLATREKHGCQGTCGRGEKGDSVLGACLLTCCGAFCFELCCCVWFCIVLCCVCLASFVLYYFISHSFAIPKRTCAKGLRMYNVRQVRC